MSDSRVITNVSILCAVALNEVNKTFDFNVDLQQKLIESVSIEERKAIKQFLLVDFEVPEIIKNEEIKDLMQNVVIAIEKKSLNKEKLLSDFQVDKLEKLEMNKCIF